nr:hypothetical protein [Sedimentibacter sp.]
MSVDEAEEKWGDSIDSVGSGLPILIYMESKESMLILYFDMNNRLNKVESKNTNNNTKIILE